ncbi:hypothetical protein XI06_13215 [Bradyrhizobium sp. CCBAU 11434]|nr:hypothetical protein [Bradyrhizobium sp. CCBAU 11434]
MNLKGIFANGGSRPHLVHQLILCDELSRRLHQHLENIKCATADRHRNAPNAEFAAIEIDLRVPTLVYGLLAWRLFVF